MAELDCLKCLDANDTQISENQPDTAQRVDFRMPFCILYGRLK